MPYRISLLPSFLVLSVLLLFQGKVKADDPGITKVRLIQLSDSTYVFEADIPQILLSSINKPVFPERFNMSDLSSSNESGWITIQLIYNTSGAPLSSDDELLLQWNRNGVDMTAQWLDGSTYKALFNRSLGGIHIPISELMTVNRPTISVLKEGFYLGFSHFRFKGIHLLFVLLLVISFPSLKSLKVLLWFSGGHYLAMLLVDAGVPGIDLLLTDLFLILTILLLSVHLIYQKKIEYLNVVLLILGISHGMSYASEIGDTGLSDIQMVQSLFSFNLAIDLAQYAFATVLVMLMKWSGVESAQKNWVPIATGGISVFLVLVIFVENVLPGNEKILDLESQNTPALRAPQTSQGGRQVQRGSGLMNTPIVTYLSVEPYEVRQEILLQAPPALEILERSQDFLEEMPLEFQDGIKEQLKDSIVANSSIIIDGTSFDPTEIQAHFVTLNRGGVSSRLEPVIEKTEQAIIGLTLVYDINNYPDSISMDWNLFPKSSREIEASAVDPHGALTFIISENSNQVRWKNRLAGYQPPTIEIVEIQRSPIPMLSYISWLIVIFIFIAGWIRKKSRPNKKGIIVLYSLVSISLILYPFLRSEIKLPFFPEGKPNKERASLIMNDLLTNVYRAFDRRVEDQVYDRLALTVTGDQLTNIYIQNRQSMAMENRGGARAKVDEVNVKELLDIYRDENGGFTADVLWTIRGSVNHFGHTHYRQNQYRALVSFLNIDDTWKINDIETIDERRLY